MAFNYDKLKEKSESQTYWASYSDLFMMLSIVFLLLYVVASLRSGTFSIQKNLEYQRISELNEDLKQQIKVYNALKEDYMEKTASEEEMTVYNNLMDKIHLLKEEAKDEKEKLRRQAQENEKKEYALNEYQQLVRNIINANMLSKVKIEKKTQQLQDFKQESAKQIKEMRLAQAETSEKLSKTKTDLTVAQRALAREGREREQLIQQLDDLKAQYSSEKAELEAQYSAEKERQKAEYEKSLKRQKLSAKQKEQALKKFRAQLEEEKEKYNSRLTDLNKKIAESETELSKAKASLNARKKLAAKIKSNFSKAGIQAEVDGKTGDVILTFGDEYFDSGKSNLKPGMKNILKQSMPVYAKSLFEDPEVAKKLSFVEVVGFASPTYKGRFVDPQSIEPEHQEAVKYNLDLSYKRASSIFDYVFDTKSMSFEQQQRLRKLVKVTGQGFLSENVKEREMASELPAKEFCKKFDCKKAQRVIIKFDIGQ